MKYEYEEVHLCDVCKKRDANIAILLEPPVVEYHCTQCDDRLFEEAMTELETGSPVRTEMN